MSKKKRDNYISKQEATSLKIELAAEAIFKVNRDRKRHNASRAVRKGDALAMAMIRPSYAAVNLRKRPGRLISNKYLCGALSQLCNAMRGAGITYPWREQEA